MLYSHTSTLLLPSTASACIAGVAGLSQRTVHSPESYGIGQCILNPHHVQMPSVVLSLDSDFIVHWLSPFFLGSLHDEMSAMYEIDKSQV